MLADGEEKDAVPLGLSLAQRVDLRSSYETGIQELVATVKRQPGITVAKSRPPAAAEIRWDRLGSIVWFTSDCQGLIDKINLADGITHADMDRYLRHSYHHAKRLSYGDGIAVTGQLIEIIKNSRERSGSDRDDPTLNKFFLSHYGGALAGALRNFANKAEALDVDYEPGPMWEEPFQA